MDDHDHNWTPLKLETMPLHIQELFVSAFPNGSELRRWVISEFEKQNLAIFNPTAWSDNEAKLFRHWWCYQQEHGDFMYRKHPRLQPMVYESLSDKVSKLAQRHCSMCTGMLSADSQFPISVFPIRIAPKSRQTLNKINWNAFQAALKDWFTKRTLVLGPSKHFCIAVTYVLSASRKDRDLDNMTKALMDALSRAVGFDDKDIHHLDILKLIVTTNEEYVIIRIGPSYLHDNSTVMVPIISHVWAVGDALRLEDFMKQ